MRVFILSCALLLAPVVHADEVINLEEDLFADELLNEQALGLDQFLPSEDDYDDLNEQEPIE